LREKFCSEAAKEDQGKAAEALVEIEGILVYLLKMITAQ
jgi:hypothetical protein